MPYPHWIGSSLLLSLVLLDTGGGGHLDRHTSRSSLHTSRSSVLTSRSSVHTHNNPRPRTYTTPHHQEQPKFQTGTLSNWEHSNRHSWEQSRRHTRASPSPHQHMFKRESSNNSTEFSDSWHLNVNVNAQTMFNFDNTDPDSSDLLSLNQTIVTCLQEEIVSCWGEGPVRDEAKAVCGSLPAASRIRRLLYHPKYSSQCWSAPDHDPSVDVGGSCPPPVLNDTLASELMGNSTDTCVNAATWVLCQILRVNEELRRVEEVMQSGFCLGEGDEEGECEEKSEHIRCYNCQECKKWYISWMCMSLWPVWLGGVSVLPCPAVCSVVQEHCPFNIILDDASTASGDPTFICSDPLLVDSRMSAKTDGEQTSTSECCYLPQQVADRAGSTADPPAGGYVDLNATVCSPLLRRGAFCDTGYSAAGLRLGNRTLGLHQLRKPEPDSNWFWDLVTYRSSARSASVGSNVLPALLVALLAVIYFHRCEYLLECMKYDCKPS